MNSQKQNKNNQEEVNLIPGHVLKIMHSKRKHHKDFGIICFPEQTYGNSIQSPDQFKGKFGFIGKRGYIYQHQHAPQFKYYSQKKYFSIDHSTNEEEVSQIHKNNQQNWLKFHRKKGKLTEFFDKNKVMLNATIMMGDQRTQKARELSNKDRDKRIRSLKPQIKYENLLALRPNTKGEYYKEIQKLTGQKMKIRSERNYLANSIVPVQPRSLKTPQLSMNQKQQVHLKMLRTTQQWNPNKKNKDSYNNYQSQRTGRLHLFNRKIQQNDSKQNRYKWKQNYEQTVQDWYRTTCSSKWVYKKKLDTDQMQQILNKASTPQI